MHRTDHPSPFSRMPAGVPAEAAWFAASRPAGASSLPVALPSVKPAMPAWLANSLGDRLFIDMLHVFRPTGGLARESELSRRWGSLHGTASPTWQESVEGGSLIRFEWSDTVWLPLFQFMPGELRPHPVAAQVVAELSPHYDGWSQANWFAQPNTWLGGQRPVDVLKDNPARLLEAARVDRFIVDV